jgi:glycine cleavage system H protein
MDYNIFRKTNVMGGIMKNFLETIVDKFIFRVATDRYYTPEGLWAKPEGASVRIGLSDFVQQRNGDVAFAEVKEVGTQLVPGEEVAVIETIKVDIAFASPVTGKVVEINPEMEDSPEIINQDPYGGGWLAVIEAIDWESDQAQLLEPQKYFEKMKIEAEEEARKL